MIEECVYINLDPKQLLPIYINIDPNKQLEQ